MTDDYDGVHEFEGHTILFMPHDMFNEAKKDWRWISCATCDRILSRGTPDPAKVVQEHVSGELEGVPTGSPRVLFG